MKLYLFKYLEIVQQDISVDRWYRWYRCVFKGMVGKENLNECLGSEEWPLNIMKIMKVFSDICTRSEGGGDVEGNKNCRW